MIAKRIISRKQNAYLKSRYMGENAIIILDIFEHSTDNDRDDILLFLDFERAFDSVLYNLMYKTL